MDFEQLRGHLGRKPFQAFRVRLKDGRTFDIVHPNLALAAESILIIGIPAADDPNPVYSDRTEWVRWPLVDGVEPLPKADAAAV